MSMFQKSVINKYLANLDEKKVEKAYKVFKKNYTLVKIEKIRLLKEEEYQDGFLRDLFVDALGYVLKPDDNYNLLREFKNQSDGKKADGAILKDGKAIAVIELKSTKTKDLTSITQQAFNYKNNQPGCKYVITSNFQKLRFYIDYADEHEEFDLFHLSREDFELLYLVLSKDSVFADIPLKLKEESVFHEENVSKQLYKDYSVFKNKLFENLVKNNSNYDKLTLFKKSQKLIDRFLFMLFAEDRGLLPPNYINRIIKRFDVLKKEDAYKPLYIIYRQYFGYMNIGRKADDPSDDIPAYNGGLFYPDKILDNLKIDDSALIDDLRKLSTYDFNSEVDVNILGHIFEHSLSAIEEITAELEGITADKTKSKRKKDGVFYTPKYITQYIVENTIGALCKEKRAQLDIVEIEFDGSFRLKKGKLSVKGQKLYDRLEEYKKWLLSLKIVDPACGSGAFLNQALNFLIEEHKIIDDIIAELTNTHLRIFDTDKAILENNLYGVDINEESIEIAKLSLWLRTAQKGRKLSVLSNNIKCGNSLIDDPEVAGEKAFNWQEEFPEIMGNGGFDIVIGNPPYLAGREWSEKLKNQKPFFEKRYSCLTDQYDLYALFIQKCYELIHSKSLFSFITPNTWFMNEHYFELRKWTLDKYDINLIGDFVDVNVFKDATVLTVVFVLRKRNKNEKIVIQKFSNFLKCSEFESSRKIWNRSAELIFNLQVSENDLDIINKIEKQSCPLSDLAKVKFGVKVYQKGKGKPKQDGSEAPVKLFENKNRENDNYFPYLHGKDILSFYYKKDLTFLKYGVHLAEPRSIDLFEGGRVLVRRIVGSKLIVCPIKETIIADQLLHSVKLLKGDYLIIALLLQSKLLSYFFKKKYNRTEKIFPEIRVKELGSLPICYPEDEQIYIITANEMLDLNQQLQSKKSKFLNRVRDNFEFEKITKKLDSFYNFDFKDFVGELKKQKIKLSLLQQDEWEEYFTGYKTEINKLQSEISVSDKTIDQMVYKLYNLTDDEIKIIENQ
jgi:type I restriction-modification system DNA methylase subunit